MGVLDAIIFEFWCITPWIFLTPVILWLARSYRFERPGLYKSITIHFFAAFILFVLHSLVQSYTVSVEFDIPFGWAYLKKDFMGFIDMRVMLYSGLLLVIYSFDFYRRDKGIELKEPLLKKELNKARFHAILNQIQPGFLLNSIDSVRESLDKDMDEAEEILTEFSDLLRIMLANIEREQVTIREDLQSYFLYTDLLQKRMGKKIMVKTDIDQECYEDFIPPFLVLIPLLEEIVDTIDGTEGELTEINYNAHRTEAQIQLEAIIKGKSILLGRISDLLDKTGITEVADRLREEYGESFRLTAEGSINEIQISLILPREEAPVDYETVFGTEESDFSQ